MHLSLTGQLSKRLFVRRRSFDKPLIRFIALHSGLNLMGQRVRQSVCDCEALILDHSSQMLLLLRRRLGGVRRAGKRALLLSDCTSTVGGTLKEAG